MPRRPRSQSGPALLQSPEFVRLALAGVEREIEQARQRLATLQAYAAELRGGTKAAAAPATGATRKKRTRRGANRLSAEARKALSERMRRKWAEYRKAKEQGTQASSRKRAKKSGQKAQPAS